MSQCSFEERIATMHAYLGGEMGEVDDEHARWALYQRAMVSPGAWGLLQRVVESESDPAVALSVVLKMLERVPPGDREAWIGILPLADKREFARRRAQELQVLESCLADDGQELGDWSVWLQRKIAEHANDVTLLAQLAERGETKRVRGMAAERLRSLSRTRQR